MGTTSTAAVVGDPNQDVHPLIAGRYRLLDRIGEGGMAEVWRAEDVRLARSVAIKLLTLFGADETEEERVHRFLREARISAAVRHPNVVDVLDFGTGEDGRAFMTMELLEGESLEERLARSPSITLGELIDIAVGMLDGLEAVHRAGIVHRDLKPDNVFLLQEDDGAVRPKLLDFGVSRAQGDLGGGRRSVLTTMQGRLVGTPEYMSPEQARGHSDVDWRTDVYSVGVMLYEAITGELPYESDALGDLIIAIAMGGAPSVASLRPDAGEAISAVIERAMRVKREDRWQSAREMRQALAEAAVASLGRDVRRSLPAPALARHLDRGDVELPDPPSLPSGLVTVDQTPARPANGTPQAFTVHAATSLPPTKPARGPWLPIGAAALVLLAGLGSWAIVRQAGEATEVAAGSTNGEDVPAEASTEPRAGARVEPSASAAAIGVGALEPSSTSEDPPAGAAASSDPEPAVRAAEPAGEADDASARELASAERAASDRAASDRPVRVILHGVPHGARISVDGEPATIVGGAVQLPSDGARHRIAVRAGDRRWRTVHRADEDGSYRVQLSRRARRANPASESPRSPASDDRALFRELDY